MTDSMLSTPNRIASRATVSNGAGSRRPLKCALLASFRFDWAASIALSAPGLDYFTFEPSALGLDAAPNPFALPLADDFDIVILSTLWYFWLVETYPDRVSRVMDTIERRSTLVVGLDAGDAFALSLPPEVVQRVPLVLKPQGVYRDRDLYNYQVGAQYPGAIWTRKLHPRSSRYRDEDLRKIHLSVPCFMMDFPSLRRDFRRREHTAARTVARGIGRQERLARNVGDEVFMRAVTSAPVRTRRRDVHCAVSLTHVQRLDAVRALQGLSGRYGVAAMRPQIQGTSFGWDLPQEVWNQIETEASTLRCAAVRRPRYLLELCRHKVGVAPTGYGELGQRHAAVLWSGATLVCQDLSHVDMMFSMVDRQNAVFCTPDLKDLRPIVDELISDDSERIRIALEGRRSLVRWASRWRQHLFDGIERPIRDALGIS